MTTNSLDITIQKQRNKLNQRAFRARRQQRVEELEQKLRQYEASQLQATQQMQQAARMVAAENAMLRDVLKQRFGVGEREIEDMRREWIGIGVASRENGHGQRVDSRDDHTQPEEMHDFEGISVESVGVTSEASPVENSRLSLDPEQQVPSTNGTACNMTSGATAQPIGNDSDSYPYPDPDPAPQIPLSNTHQHTGTTSSMSCEKAAEILSSIRTQDELDDVRSRLGCKTQQTCMVKNTRIMDMMNESF